MIGSKVTLIGDGLQIGEFCLVVEFHQAWSSTKGVTSSSYLPNYLPQEFLKCFHAITVIARKLKLSNNVTLN